MIEIIFSTGDGSFYHYTMQSPAEKQIREFGEGKWSEIVMLEASPEIRRGRPVSFTIKRVPDTG